MAEIKIERKKSGVPVWAILLVIIVLALIAWFLLAGRNRTQTVNNTALLQWSAPAPVHLHVPATRCA